MLCCGSTVFYVVTILYTSRSCVVAILYFVLKLFYGLGVVFLRKVVELNGPLKTKKIQQPEGEEIWLGAVTLNVEIS